MTPVLVSVPVKKVIMAAAGDQTSAIVANSDCYAGEVYTWGSNMFGNDTPSVWSILDAYRQSWSW